MENPGKTLQPKKSFLFCDKMCNKQSKTQSFHEKIIIILQTNPNYKLFNNNHNNRNMAREVLLLNETIHQEQKRKIAIKYNIKVEEPKNQVFFVVKFLYNFLF